MKHIVDHPERTGGGRRYWRSLGDLEDTPQFREWLHREFPRGANELEMDPVSRRSFLRLMGASMALAGFGMAGCRRPEGYVVPYVRSPEWQIPGKPLLYATAMPRPGGAMPLIVTTHDGRPTKIEGNPLHPGSNGGTDAIAQASVLDLYDPDRARGFVRGGAPASQDEFDAFLDAVLAEIGIAGGGGAAILAGSDNSPTRARIRRLVQKKFPKLLWAEYEAAESGERAAAHRAVFGSGVTLRPRLDAATTILALDADVLGAEPGVGGPLEASAGFAARRRAFATAQEEGGGMNRLYVVEPAFTVTGGMADHRVRCAPGRIGVFAAALALQLGADGPLAEMARAFAPDEGEFDSAMIGAIAADLQAHRGEAAVIVGERQPRAVHALVCAINEALGAFGRTMDIVRMPAPPDAGDLAEPATIRELASAVNEGRIATLFVLGADPAFTAPADLGWTDLQRSVKTVVRHGLHYDDTSKASLWHVPAAHYLESWGDTFSSGGTYSVVQPLIAPLFGGLSEIELLARMAGVLPEQEPMPEGPPPNGMKPELPAAPAMQLVQETFHALFELEDLKAGWHVCLRDGFYLSSNPRAEVSASDYNAAAAVELVRTAGSASAAPGPDAMEVALAPHPFLYDGRYANNGWLQELPDPVTRITWGNAAVLSPATSRALGVRDNDLVRISVDGRSVTLPVYVGPGAADNVATLALGFGRNDPGRRVLDGAGFDVYPLLGGLNPMIRSGATVARAGGQHDNANTQEHHSMEGRDHVREGTLERFAEDPAFAAGMGIDSHIPPNISLYHAPPMTAPHQWGMTIDLNLCTGCNVCTVACQAENNIPIVGREQVINGREMHWIRIDRYYASKDAADPNPEMVMQPVPCMHCENAPCEVVCPVNATVHNEEGLNVMTYNRCIGTRYCANNCPYKVRRFNYFDYNKRRITQAEILPGFKTGNLYLGPLGAVNDDRMIEMQKNPNVTVRMRGVIEKCTFCVQRLEEAKIDHKVRNAGTADVVIPRDSVKTACQQACPTQAIAFGNIADAESAVSKARSEPRAYVLLKYLNVNPRVSYLARLKNPNPAMPDAAGVGAFNVGGHHGHGDGVHDAHEETAHGAGEGGNH